MLSGYYMRSAVLMCTMLHSLNLDHDPRRSGLYYPHFVDKSIKAQRGQITFTRSHSRSVTEPEAGPGCLAPEARLSTSRN